MQHLRGIPVSPGVAIGDAHVITHHKPQVREQVIGAGQVADELQRFESARAGGIEELDALRNDTAATLGSDIARIFDFHRGLLHDPALLAQIRGIIENERVDAARAVYRVFQQVAAQFDAVSDRYLRERVTDLYDLQQRLLTRLGVRPVADPARLESPCVLVARDLSPSQTAGLNRRLIRGIVTEAGGRTSHTAILAHAMGIPAVVGVRDATQVIANGDSVIVDGRHGTAVVNPQGPQLMAYKQAVRRAEAGRERLSALNALPARTRCGAEIELLANIEFPHEIDEALQLGAVGVGLYRTEFLFLSSGDEPSEQEQYEAYREVITRLDGRPLTLRTLDLGADKALDANSHRPSRPTAEPNPVLGCRSIRLCLQNLPMFKTQLRAVLRASTHGPVRVMFPLISSLLELRQAKTVLADVREDLQDQGVEVPTDLEVGMMIEVPSAALQARAFAAEADFFSIGTNDLVQYTLAVDRGNEQVAPLYNAAHPAVLMLLKDLIRNSSRTRTPTAICGEMAGQAEFVMLLLGLGLRTFSVTPPALPEIKQVIRAVSIEQCKRTARRAADLSTGPEVARFLADELARVMPDRADLEPLTY